jgi:hypothetical protein
MYSQPVLSRPLLPSRPGPCTVSPYSSVLCYLHALSARTLPPSVTFTPIPGRAFETRWWMNFFKLPNSSSRTISLRFIQPLTEMSTRKCSWGVQRGRRVRLTTSQPSVSRLSRQHLTALWASTACYRDSFTFTYKNNMKPKETVTNPSIISELINYLLGTALDKQIRSMLSTNHGTSHTEQETLQNKRSVYACVSLSLVQNTQACWQQAAVTVCVTNQRWRALVTIVDAA